MLPFTSQVHTHNPHTWRGTLKLRAEVVAALLCTFSDTLRGASGLVRALENTGDQAKAAARSRREWPKN
ncbi:hypothetical protein CBM2585_B80122 [Cupriavidus taiwanensis]|nr:hypothetical protein CBM2585_B80122 [Cupriavidus taiwanensis]